jgi:GNAT superfamily N-acetyltransferase
VEIRPATVDDGVLLAPLAEGALRATYAPFAQRVVYESVIAQTCTPQALAATIAAATDGAGGAAGWFLVAVEGERPVGFLDFGGDGHGLELRRLYTAADQTGRGIGAALLADLEARLAPGTTYTAIVHVANTRALAFWARHGFETVGVVDTRDHFQAHRGLSFTEPAEPEPALILERVVGQGDR